MLPCHIHHMQTLIEIIYGTINLSFHQIAGFFLSHSCTNLNVSLTQSPSPYLRGLRHAWAEFNTLPTALQRLQPFTSILMGPRYIGHRRWLLKSRSCNDISVESTREFLSSFVSIWVTILWYSYLIACCQMIFKRRLQWYGYYF